MIEWGLGRSLEGASASSPDAEWRELGWSTVWIADLQERVLMAALGLAGLTEVEVFTNGALIPDSDYWVNFAGVTDNPIVNRLLIWLLWLGLLANLRTLD